MRSIYVAGGSDERDECQKAIEALEATGEWKVTFKWPKEQSFTGPIVPGGHMRDVDGIEAAQFFWQRVPEKKSEGAFFELGVASILRDYANSGRLGRSYQRRIVIVSGPFNNGPLHEGRRIFAEVADLKFATHEQALAWLIDGAP